MSERDDGGPAFPETWTNDGDLNSMAPDGTIVPPGTTITMRGMSLRDYFAAQVIGPATSNPQLLTSHDHAQGANNIAKAAYILSDAMLRARKS